MKKFTRILALCMLVIMVAMTFSSCGVLTLNFTVARVRLEAKGYEVEVTDPDEIDDESDEATSLVFLSLIFGETPEKILKASKDDENISICKFDSSKDAKDAKENLEEFREDYSDDASEDFVYVTRGKLLIIGTEQGVKDALGFPGSLFVSLFN